MKSIEGWPDGQSKWKIELLSLSEKEKDLVLGPQSQRDFLKISSQGKGNAKDGCLPCSLHSLPEPDLPGARGHEGPRLPPQEQAPPGHHHLRGGQGEQQQASRPHPGHPLPHRGGEGGCVEAGRVKDGEEPDHLEEVNRLL